MNILTSKLGTGSHLFENCYVILNKGLISSRNHGCQSHFPTVFKVTAYKSLQIITLGNCFKRYEGYWVEQMHK